MVWAKYSLFHVLGPLGKGNSIAFLCYIRALFEYRKNIALGMDLEVPHGPHVAMRSFKSI